MGEMAIAQEYDLAERLYASGVKVPSPFGLAKVVLPQSGKLIRKSAFIRFSILLFISFCFIPPDAFAQKPHLNVFTLPDQFEDVKLNFEESGIKIGEAIRVARIDAIKGAIKEWKKNQLL